MSLTLTSLQANANCKEIEAACKKVITASGEYIAELKRENEFQLALINQYEISDRETRRLLTQRERELRLWYRDPVAMTSIGLIAGLVLGIAIHNK